MDELRSRPVAETTDQLLERIVIKMLTPMMKRLEDKANAELIAIDRETLRKRLKMTKSYFETYVVDDSRLKAIQHRAPSENDNARKIYYPADEAKKVCLEILAEWPQ